MRLVETAAREAGRALGDLGAGEQSALVGEVARALAELGAEPPGRRRGARRQRAGSRDANSAGGDPPQGGDPRAPRAGRAPSGS